MKVIFDLQSLQTRNADKTVGDEALLLAQALLRHAGNNELLFSVNQTLFEEMQSRPGIYKEFRDPGLYLVWQSIERSADSDPGNAWRSEASGMIYEQFIHSQAPDIFHMPSFFEGYDDDAVTVMPKLFNDITTIVTLHDPSAVLEKKDAEWGRKKIQDLKKAERVVTHSEAVRDIAVSLLESDEKVVLLSKVNESGQDTIWDEVAIKLWSLYEDCAKNKNQAVTPKIENNKKKLRLAYLSPLPPEQSGIADYSAEILPALSKYYDIDLVTNLERIDDPYLESNFKKYKIAEFHQRVDEYDRVIYHFGNSIFHVQLYPLLQRYPGIVVLHDVYLSGLFFSMAEIAPESNMLHRQIYESHGYPALLELEENFSDTAWGYPTSRKVMEMSEGVIVHSEHAHDLCRTWYGDGVAKHMKVAMLPRKVAENTDRDAARKRLGIDEDVFLVCAYGYIGHTKLNDRLLSSWLSSDMSRDKECRLVFVGEGGGSPYEVAIRSTIRALSKKNIKITGFVSASKYKDYLAAADVGVQLRTKSRGETSISVLDGMSNGIPMVVNAHGAFAELPGDVVYMLPDEFTDEELRGALEELHEDSKSRQELGARGKEYVKKQRSLETAAEKYYECIEEFAEENPVAQEELLVDRLSCITSASPTKIDMMRAAGAIYENNVYMPKKQLLVDVSALVRVDLKTGIQRVVRSVLHELLINPPEGYRVEPIHRSDRHFRYARKFTCDFLGLPDCLDDPPADISPGDIYLGLDWHVGLNVSELDRYLIHHKQRGVKLIYVVYDILPLLRQDCFPRSLIAEFQEWFDHVIGASDGLACISKSVANEVDGWLNEHRTDMKDRPDIGYFHLGADIVSSKHTTGMSASNLDVLKKLEGKTTLLMVGTVEPRKGYSSVLSAMDEVWKRGADVNLVIVGKPGWKRGGVISRLRKHAEKGSRLFWLEEVSDEFLMKLYEISSALLLASEGEGFGLPLIESAQHSLPIICRDIPVFREVAGEHAYYFPNDKKEAFSRSILDWLDLYQAGEHPTSDGLTWLTWGDATRQLLDIIIGDNWYIKDTRPE